MCVCVGYIFFLLPIKVLGLSGVSLARHQQYARSLNQNKDPFMYQHIHTNLYKTKQIQLPIVVSAAKIDQVKQQNAPKSRTTKKKHANHITIYDDSGKNPIFHPHALKATRCNYQNKKTRGKPPENSSNASRAIHIVICCDASVCVTMLMCTY